MKKFFSIIIFLLVIMFCINGNVKAYEGYYDLEYYNISYDFINDNEFYVTYTFKPQNMINVKAFLREENIYVDTIEHNLDDYKLIKSVNEGMATISFSLNEFKEYYIKYKGYFKGDNNILNGLCIKALSKYKSPRNACDYFNAMTVYSFRLNIYHPENIDLNKEKIKDIDYYILEDEGESYSLLAGEKYERERYYTGTIYKEIITKADIEYENNLKQFIFYGTVVFIVAMYAIYRLKIR